MAMHQLVFDYCTADPARRKKDYEESAFWPHRILSQVLRLIDGESDTEDRLASLGNWLQSMDDMVDLSSLHRSVQVEKIFWTVPELVDVMRNMTPREFVDKVVDLDALTGGKLFEYNFSHMLVCGTCEILPEVSFLESLCSMPASARLIYQLLVYMDADVPVVRALSPQAKKFIKMMFIV
jgi:hypothetical protein